MTVEIPNVLAEAFEQIKREAYAAGWNDAMEAVKGAIGGLSGPKAPELQKSPSGPAPLPQNNDAVAGITMGSTPYYVLHAIRAKPGMGSTEVVGAVREGGHSAPEGSIRTTIFRLKERKLIVARHGKWFPA